MLATIRKLPVTLRAVVWVNLCGALLEATVAGVCYFQSLPREALTHLADAVATLLVVAGVLRRYGLIRVLCLVLSYAGVIVESLSLLIALRASSPLLAVYLVGLGFFIFMIWALSVPEAKAYFKTA